MLAIFLGTRANAGDPAAAEPVRIVPPASGSAASGPRYDLAFLEASAILVGGTAWYWWDQRTNRRDWDDPPFLARFDGDAWRLDNNRFGINFLGHPLTGALSYGLARAHRFGPGGAFLFAFGTSLAWELGIEFKEKVSINDVLVTGPTGVPIGEVAYKLGTEVAEALSPTVDGASPVPPRRYRRMDITYSAGDRIASGVVPAFVQVIRYRGDIVWLSDYRREASFSKWFYQAEAATLGLDVLGTAHGFGFAGEATTLLAGYHAQDLLGDSDGIGPSHRQRGWAVTAGIPLGFRYVASSALGFRELVASMRMPGLSASVALSAGDWRLEAYAQANADFAGLSAPSYPAWRTENPGGTGKTILAREGYFYGFGPSGRASLTLGFGPIEIGAEGSFLRIRSLDGLDRAQETLTVDQRVRTQLWDGTLRISSRIAQSPARVEGQWGATSWTTAIDDRVTKWTSRAVTAGVSFAF